MVACSKAKAIRNNFGSLQASAKNDIPTGRPSTIPAGTVITTLDQFSTANNFNGGILGLQWQRNCGCWTTQVLTRIQRDIDLDETRLHG